jgi:hypothetical protein
LGEGLRRRGPRNGWAAAGGTCRSRDGSCDGGRNISSARRCAVKMVLTALTQPAIHAAQKSDLCGTTVHLRMPRAG